MATIQKLINDKFRADFRLSQIRYRVNKLLSISYGKPELDAYSFVSLAEKEVNDHGGYFNYKVQEDSSFDSAIFVSKTMLKYSEFFNDFILVDATYRRNR